MINGPPPINGPLQPDKSMSGSLIAFVWTLSGISGIIIALRLFAVYKVLNRVRAADYLMVAAYITILITGVLITKSCQYGIGRHIYYLSPDQILNAMKYTTVMVGPLVFATMLARLSFCAFLLATFGPKKIARVILWIAMVSQVLVNLSQVIIQYAACGTHISTVWNRNSETKCVSYATMINYLYFLSAWNTSSDLFLTIFPAVLMKDIKIARKKKLIIIVLLCLSGFAFVASLVRCIMTKDLAELDMTWALAKLGFWVMTECHVVIIVASIPLLNSLIKWSKETITQRSYGSANRSPHHVTVKQSWAVEREGSIDAEKLSNQQSEI